MDDMEEEGEEEGEEALNFMVSYPISLYITLGTHQLPAYYLPITLPLAAPGLVHPEA